MSHRYVEVVVGRLVSDEQFRLQFQRAADRVLDDLEVAGVVLTTAERRALVATSCESWKAMAAGLDPRLQKASLRKDDRDVQA